MSQVWSGNITTGNSATCIKDIHIWAHSIPSKPALLSSDAKLHFLSLVEVARIPLHLAAGPSYDVSTGDETTRTWLTEALLAYDEHDFQGNVSTEPWWSQMGSQSENGILLGVETQNEGGSGIENVATEVLIYAAVAQTSTALSTPPNSSSPAPRDENVASGLDQAGKLIKVYALPLCSNIISRAKVFVESCPPISTDLPSAAQACFLPHTRYRAEIKQPPPQKRQGISTLFDDATKKRRKMQGRGGESISQAMASIDRPSSQHGLPETEETPQLQQNDPRRKSLSRAPSMTPVASTGSSRPTSRSGALANHKRSSLHRVESAIAPHDSPALSDTDGTCAQENKDALTKVIMAGMRLHGLQQKRKPTDRSQVPSQPTWNETHTSANEPEDEYKLVYHQTLKAALFTFRKALIAQLISQETMRVVVDRLLTMFCTDPMTADPAPDGGDFRGFETNGGLSSSSPFDKPSREARCSSVTNGWKTPTVKKR